MNAVMKPYPAPRLTRQVADMAMRFAAPTAPWAAPSVGPALEIRIGGAPRAMGHDALSIAARIGGDPAAILAPRSLAQNAVRWLDASADFDAMEPEEGAIALELAFLPLIETLEKALGEDIALLGAEPARAIRGDVFLVNATMTATPEGGAPSEWPLRLMLGPARLRQLASAPRIETPDAPFSNIPAILRARIGVTDMAMDDLKALTVGDVALLERRPHGGGAILVFGERYGLRADIGQSGKVVTRSAFARLSAQRDEDFVMSDAETRLIDDAALEDAPVKLVFELGRVELPYSALRSLGVGAPLALDRAPGAAVDVFANGRRVAVGEVVMIGDAMGVRITRMTGAS